MDVKKIKGTEYLTCSCCGGEVDENGECRNYCPPDLEYDSALDRWTDSKECATAGLKPR